MNRKESKNLIEIDKDIDKGFPLSWLGDVYRYEVPLITIFIPFCYSHSLFLSLSLCLSLFLFLCLPLPLRFSLYICVSVCLSVSPLSPLSTSFYPFLTFFPTFPLSLISLYLSIIQYKSIISRVLSKLSRNQELSMNTWKNKKWS